MQLRNDNTFGTVDDERTARGHVGDRTEIYVLHDRIEILMLRIGTIELEFRLEGYAVSQTALQALVNRIAGRVDIVIDEFQNEIVPSIRNREILSEHLVKAFILTVFGRSVQLEKVVK